jgi:hypothetical protein
MRHMAVVPRRTVAETGKTYIERDAERTTIAWKVTAVIDAERIRAIEVHVGGEYIGSESVTLDRKVFEARHVEATVAMSYVAAPA